jgi:hypothetical protein
MATHAIPMVELTVQVDLFSSFYEKLFSNHQDKSNLLNYLDRLKNYLYQNPSNLERGLDFISDLECEIIPAAAVLPSNGGYRRESDLLQTRVQQYQPELLPNQKSHFEGKAPTLPHFDCSNVSNHKQVTIYKIFEFHTYKIFSNADDIFNLIHSSFSHIKEVQKDGNTFFRIFGIRYIESLLAEGNEKTLQRILSQVYNRTGGMQTMYLTDDITLKEEHRFKFCGYVKQILQALASGGNHYQTSQNLFLAMVNGDQEFLTAILGWCRTSFINFLEEEGNFGIIKKIDSSFDSWKIRNLAHSIKTNMEEPSVILVKLASHIFERKIRLILVNENQIFDDVFSFNSKPTLPSTNINILCLSNTFTVYYALYEAVDVFWDDKEIPSTVSFKKLPVGKTEMGSRHQTPLTRDQSDLDYPRVYVNNSNTGNTAGATQTLMPSQSQKNLVLKQQNTPKTPNPRAIKTFITENNQHMESEMNRSSHIEKENRGMSPGPGELDGMRAPPNLLNVNQGHLNKSNKRSLSSQQPLDEEKNVLKVGNESFTFGSEPVIYRVIFF